MRNRTRVRIRGAIAVALLGAGTVCGALAFSAHPASAGAGHQFTVRTPLWSPRRVPGPIVEEADRERTTPSTQELQAALDADVAHYGNSCFLVTKGTQVLATHNANTPLIPASTQKLLTAAAALVKLGPDFRYETKVVATAATGSVTLDRLWLVGSGRPDDRHRRQRRPRPDLARSRNAPRIARGCRGCERGSSDRRDRRRRQPVRQPAIPGHVARDVSRRLRHHADECPGRQPQRHHDRREDRRDGRSGDVRRGGADAIAAGARGRGRGQCRSRGCTGRGHVHCLGSLATAVDHRGVDVQDERQPRRGAPHQGARRSRERARHHRRRGRRDPRHVAGPGRVARRPDDDRRLRPRPGEPVDVWHPRRSGEAGHQAGAAGTRGGPAGGARRRSTGACTPKVAISPT